MRRTIWTVMGMACLAATGMPPRAHAETIEQRLERLEKRIEEQDRIIKKQQKEIDQLHAAPAPAPAAAAAPAPGTPGAAPATAAAPPSPDTMRAYFKEGLRFETADKKFQTHVGGRIQIDNSQFAETQGFKNEFGSVENASEIRRARIQIDGLIYGRIDYMLEYDFATGQAEAKDVYMGLIDVPYAGTLRVGHFKEPFSLEEVTSDNYITFMERALPNAFAPSRNLGIMAYNDPLDQRMTWALGAFRGNSDNFGAEVADGGWALTGRVTGLPLWLNDGYSLVHLGAAASYRDPQGEAERFSARPEDHQGPVIVDTDNFTVNTSARFGGELVAQHGPLWFQGEYLDALTQDPQHNLY